jgi:hypothetical protein
MTSLQERTRRSLSPTNQWSAAEAALQLHSRATHPHRHLEIQFRSDGDVDVAFFLDNVKGSPFEQQFIVHAEPEEEAARAISAFVEDILTELVVLVWLRGPTGGRRFTHAPLTETQRVRWAASWLGTYDRNLPVSGRLDRS